MRKEKERKEKQMREKERERERENIIYENLISSSVSPFHICTVSYNFVYIY